MSCITCHPARSMVTMASLQKEFTSETPPEGVEKLEKLSATIVLVYASQIAVSARLRSADASGAYTSDRAKVSRAPKTRSDRTLFICVPPVFDCLCLVTARSSSGLAHRAHLGLVRQKRARTYTCEGGNLRPPVGGSATPRRGIDLAALVRDTAVTR